MKKFNTDKVMEKLWLCLVSDFRNVLGMDYARSATQVFLNSGIKGLRNYKFPYRSQANTTIFKCDYQLENLFKRYKFEDDVFTQSDLVSASQEKFEATQVRVAQPITMRLYGHLVIQRARGIISSVLGKFDPNEHVESCSFGKRACVGTAYADSYLDIKLSRVLTGSKDHITWFHDNVTCKDAVLQRTLCESLGTDRSKWYKECDTLKLSLAPKSYKALRSIMPDTLIGSFYTNGLGKIIAKRLRSVGLDISKLQMTHRQLAQTASRDRRLVTADLSAASDSIGLELLRRLLPSKWFAAITYGRIDQVLIDKRTIKLSSVITMGLGHTFPLQTLIFYSLIKAIGELVSNRAVFVSVYGDDLIYPRSIHRYVEGVFRDFHLNMNKDKTYAQDYFRESCGGDYHHGYDVRPYQPEGEHKLLDTDDFVGFLYKLYNGLVLRWDPVEIPNTLEYLEGLIILTKGIVFQVPPSFPDESGIKVDRPVTKYFYSPVNKTTPNYSFKFQYLRYVSDVRQLKFLGPYYWECLRTKSSAKPHPWEKPADRPLLSWRNARKKRRSICYRLTDDSGLFWVHDVPPIYPVVADKTSGRNLQQTGTVCNWI